METPQHPDARPATYRAQERLIEAELAAFQATLVQTPPGPELPVQAGRALCYIHVHLFDGALNAASVCARCGLSNHNDLIHFKRVMGMGMHEYIERLRIQAAERLLRHEALGVCRIGWAVGYNNPESFNRAFKRCTGSTPTQHRQRLSRPNVKSDG